MRGPIVRTTARVAAAVEKEETKKKYSGDRVLVVTAGRDISFESCTFQHLGAYAG